MQQFAVIASKGYAAKYCGIYFHSLKYSVFRYFCLLKNRCKYQEIKAEILNSCFVFIFLSQPKCIQCVAKTTELALLFQYFWRGLYHTVTFNSLWCLDFKPSEMAEDC